MRATHALLAIALLLPAVAAQDIGTAVVDTLPQAQAELAGHDILTVYLREGSKLLVLQQRPLLDEDAVDAVIREYEPGLQGMDDPGREERLRLAASELERDLELLGGIAEDDEAGEELARLPETVPGQPSPLCGLLKDGVCDRACPALDLDCQCGDGACQGHESQATCPMDCRPPQNRLCPLVRDGTCDAACRFDIDCAATGLVETAMAYYADDDRFYARAMTVLSAAMAVLFGLAMWLLHDIYGIRLGGWR
jgi:hypothetical protein